MSVVLTSSHHRAWSRFNFQLSFAHPHVEARGFSLSVEYKKLLYDAVSGETSYATTGEIGGAGSHGGDAGFILQGLSEYLDGFILDYLRVNESACK